MNEELFEQLAISVWKKLTKRPMAPKLGIADKDNYSANNLRVIDRLLGARSGGKKEHPGDFLFVMENNDEMASEREARIFDLGCYVGEVVRRGLKGAKWDDSDPKRVKLLLPDGREIFPINFIEQQVTDYKDGAVVNWATDAGLFNQTKNPPA